MRLQSLLLFLIAFQSFGQNSLLYSIKKKDAPVSYLFGTTHLIADSAFYFPQKLEKILAKADVLVLEINDIADQSKAKSLLTLESGSAFDIFTKEQADSVINWGSNQLNMSPEAFRNGFEHRKPFALMQISVQTILKGSVRFYEFELMSRAVSNDQQLLGLESMEYQMGIFDNIPDSIMAEMIMTPIRFPEEGKKADQELTELYVKQDVEGLAKLVTESDGIGQSAEELVFNRNRNWIPVMENYMKSQSCFFAVGAGHLGGEQGVIQLLKNAGYTVTPIHY